MSFSSLVEGESRLFGVLGANVTLGGVHAVAEKAHTKLVPMLPLISDILVLVQVAVGVATLVYMILKIRRVLRKKSE